MLTNERISFVAQWVCLCCSTESLTRGGWGVGVAGDGGGGLRTDPPRVYSRRRFSSSTVGASGIFAICAISVNRHSRAT